MTWLFWAGAAAIVTYELWAAVSKKAPTISQAVWWAPVGQKVALAFCAGVLAGHLFF